MTTSLKAKIRKLETFNTDGIYSYHIIKSCVYEKPGIHKIYGTIKADNDEEANIVIKRVLGKTFRGTLVLPRLSMSGEMGMYGESFGGSAGLKLSRGYAKPGSKKMKGIFD